VRGLHRNTTETATADAPTEAEARAETPYAKLGGAKTFAAFVERFYDLMENDPEYAELRAMHAPDLTPMRVALAQFLAGWAGGPRDWFEANPGKCMVSAHSGFAIDGKTAGQWADAMTRAIAETPIANRELADALARQLTLMAEGFGRPAR